MWYNSVPECGAEPACLALPIFQVASAINAMSKKRQRSWLTRLEQIPQRAGRRFTTQFHRIPQRIRFLILTLILSVLTAFLVSNYPVSILPQYHVGDVAGADLVAPVDFIVNDDIGEDELTKQ